MLNIDGKTLCSSCFSPITKEPCKFCGFSEEKYVPEKAALPCGTILMGSFVIGKMLGMGGFGITYLAYNVNLHEIIAIKEYFPVELAYRASDGISVTVRDKKAAQMFKQGAEKFYNEASFVANFSSNENIVHVYQFFYENNTAYFTMEYLSGVTLKDYVNRCGTITAGQAVNIADKVANALSEVHKENVLHRDVSPDNIMLCKDGSIKLLDFGAARQVYPEGSQLLTIILKPGFAPLEQYMKRGVQGPWTDIYSLGSSLFYAMTKHIPDDPQTRFYDDSDIENNKYDIDPRLWFILYKAMALRYTDRYQTVEEMIAALEHQYIKSEKINVRKLLSQKSNKTSPIKALLLKILSS